MLVVNIKGDFMKKAIGKTIFTCCDGPLIKQTIEDAITTGKEKPLLQKARV